MADSLPPETPSTASLDPLEIEERLVLLRQASENMQRACMPVTHVVLLREGVVWMLCTTRSGLYWADLEDYRQGRERWRHMPGGLAQVNYLVRTCGAPARLLALEAYVEELSQEVG